MIVDGKALAAQMYDSLKAQIAVGATPQLHIFTCDPRPETQTFLRLKKLRAAEVGIKVQVTEFLSDISLVHAQQSLQSAQSRGEMVVVQLPFPAHMPVDELLGTIAATYDPEAIRYAGETSDVLPPVVGAIDVIAQRHEVTWEGARVVVVGAGRLVGEPAAAYARSRGAIVEVCTKHTTDLRAHTKHADILILGAGVPGLITPEHVAAGVTIFDAGTSEVSGALMGDAAPEVADKAVLFTPVPGGIGPLTIAVLLQNTVTLKRKH